MTAVGRTRLGRSIAAFSAVTGLVAVLIHMVDGTVGLLDAGNFVLHFAVAAVGFGALVWIVLPSQPRNGVIWALAGSALAAALALTGTVVLALAAPDQVANYGELVAHSPSELSTIAGVGAMFAGGTWVASLFLALGVGLLLFPDGRPPSPRWRWLVWFNLVSVMGITLGLTLASNPNSTTPIETSGENFDGVAGAIVGELFFPMVAGTVLAIVSLVVRYRRSSGVARPQIRWIAFGGVAFLLAAIAADPDTVLWPLLGGQLLFIAAFLIAMTRYRLYDIDVIVSKSVTYLGLAAAITLLYVAVVVLPVLIIGQSDGGEPGLTLPIIATTVVAFLFEPIRSRLQRWANRFVYGKRATPHEVLSQVTARLSDTTSGHNTAELAKVLAEGTGAEQAVVWLQTGDSLFPEGTWPTEGASMKEPISIGDLIDDDTTESRPVVHGETSFGALTITKPPDDPITTTDRELLSDVAAGTGPLLRNISLNRELEERAKELRGSRRRLIAAQDAERHRLERNLHDGAQQQVVALKVKLGIAKTIAEREGADGVADQVATLADETQLAIDALRATAHGIYPPLLEAEGLRAAVRSFEREDRGGITVDIVVGDLARYSGPIEQTVYFCLMSMIAGARTAGANAIHASLTEVGGTLDVVVRYDADVGEIRSVIDRIDAVGGTVTALGEEGMSTVRALLPLEVGLDTGRTAPLEPRGGPGPATVPMGAART